MYGGSGCVGCFVERERDPDQVFDLRSVDSLVWTALKYHPYRDIKGVEFLLRPRSSCCC